LVKSNFSCTLDKFLVKKIHLFDLTYKVEKGNGRRFAIGDIHGCALTFNALLEQIAPTVQDQIFILGDMINRGKRSKKVIKKILELQTSGYNVYPLRGNHENQFLKYVCDLPTFFYKHYLTQRNMDNFLEKDGKVKEKYLFFFHSLPYYFELDTCFLVHAGFNYRNPFDDASSMLLTREAHNNYSYLRGKRLIHAHTPIGLSRIKDMVVKMDFKINLDNGCVLKNKEIDKGNLVCLDIDSHNLYVQKNID
jgi:serine/threonine protein phosphatase 1